MMPMSSNRVLDLSLLANAAFSLASGLVLVLSPSAVSDWLGISASTWLRLFGIGLVGHAGILLWARGRPEVKRWAKLNFLAIAPYPLLMFAVVGFGLVDKPLGQAIVIADGAIVGLIAFGHWMGLRTQRVSVDAEPA